MPLSERDETADVCMDSKGKPEPDPDLRDYENVPLKEDIKKYMASEVLPHVPDAWVDEDKTKIGYEITKGMANYRCKRCGKPVRYDMSSIPNLLVIGQDNRGLHMDFAPGA